MKLIVFIIISTHFHCVFCGNTWPTMEITNNTVKHRGHCYSSLPGVGNMEKGEYKTLKDECVMAMCDESGIIYYHVCGRVTKPPPYCKLYVPELNRPYPDCCPYVDCYTYDNEIQ